MFLNLLSSLSLRCSAFPQHFNLVFVYLTSESGCDLLTHIFFFASTPPKDHTDRHTRRDETLPLISKFLLQKLSCWICKLAYFVCLMTTFYTVQPEPFNIFWTDSIICKFTEWQGKRENWIIGVLNRQVVGTDCLTLSRCSRLSIKKTTTHSFELQ